MMGGVYVSLFKTTVVPVLLLLTSLTVGGLHLLLNCGQSKNPYFKSYVYSPI